MLQPFLLVKRSRDSAYLAGQCLCAADLVHTLVVQHNNKNLETFDVYFGLRAFWICHESACELITGGNLCVVYFRCTTLGNILKTFFLRYYFLVIFVEVST